MVAIRSLVFSMLLLSVVALFSQQASAAAFVNKLDKDTEMLENAVKRLYSDLKESTEAKIAHPDSTSTIMVGNFGRGFSAELSFIAPETESVELHLMNSTTGNTPIAVIVRYKQPSYDDYQFIVNHKHAGYWGDEVRPSGYDFTAGIEMTLKVVANQDNWSVYADNQLITNFSYRIEPELDTVKGFAEDATLNSLSVSV